MCLASLLKIILCEIQLYYCIHLFSLLDSIPFKYTSICSFVDGHLDFQIFAFKNKATVNIHE